MPCCLACYLASLSGGNRPDQPPEATLSRVSCMIVIATLYHRAMPQRCVSNYLIGVRVVEYNSARSFLMNESGFWRYSFISFRLYFFPCVSFHFRTYSVVIMADGFASLSL